IFPNPGWQILPGMDVKIQAQVGSPKPHLLVDERALGTDQKGDFLLVVGKDNVVEYRTVQLGSRIGGMRVIEAGLQKGDWVGVNGLQRARPGAPVTPEQKPMPDQTAEDSTAAPKPDANTPSAPAAEKNKSAKENETVSASSQPAAKRADAQNK